jgi:hypothetical protein
MRVERADPALLVAEHDDLLAQELFLARQIAQLVRSADRLPVAPHKLAHRASRLDTGQLVIGCGGLASIGRLHRAPPLSPGAEKRELTPKPGLFNSARRAVLGALLRDRAAE